VALDEIDPATMASRRCPGLVLVGEMLDVDGRIGGFNFQWAWSSARVAARALAAGPAPPG
jgi:predicted flavoprotein YhiN